MKVTPGTWQHDIYLEIDRIKTELGALAPVTVIAQSASAARDMKLAISKSFPALSLVNVSFVTTRTVVDSLIHALDIQGARKILSLENRALYIMKSLEEYPGSFELVADQYQTALGIAKASQDLDLGTAPKVFSQALTEEVWRLHMAARDLYSQKFVSYGELLKRLLEHEGLSNACGELGSLILCTPAALPNPLEANLFKHLQNASRATTIETISIQRKPSEIAPHSYSDMDDEVRSVLRLIATDIEAGVAPGEIGIIVPSRNSYVGLIQKHARHSNIALSGASSFYLSDLPQIRVLLELLEFAGKQLAHEQLVDLLSLGALKSPLLNPLPSTRALERALREDGALAEDTDSDPEDTLTENEEPKDRSAKFYLEFKAELEKRLSDIAKSKGFSAQIAAIDGFVNDFLRIPKEIYVEGTKVELAVVLGELLNLSRFDMGLTEPNLRMIVDALSEEATSSSLNLEKLGNGVSIQIPQEALGRSLAKLYCLGMAEGLTPRKYREDPLLSNIARAELGIPETTTLARIESDFNTFTMVLQASTSEPILAYPRGDLRAGGNRPVSRWVSIDENLKESVGASYIGGLGSGSLDSANTALNVGEWAIRRILAKESVADNGQVAHKLEARRMLLESRNPVNPAWNEYNGNLAEIREKVSARFYGKPQSSSGLEKWIKNPIEYLMTNLLGVDVLEDIDGSKRMQANVKGSIVHNALEDWVNEILEAKTDEQWLWSIEALLAKAEIHLEEARSAHPAWLPVIFEADSELIKYELSEVHGKWLIPERGVWNFRSAELAFGMDPEREPNTLPPIEIPIDHSHTLRLRGKIDRLDEQVTDGVLNLRVIDYKTGSSKELKDGLKLSGEYIQKIQLPIYGKLAKQILADQKGYVAGVAQLQYWFTSVKGGFVDSGESQLSGDIEQVFDKTMLEIASQITNGVFPGINSEDDYKPFVTVSDRIGKFSLSALWNGLKSKAELSELTKLKGLKEGEE
jgi:hypothetical protein